MFEQKEREKGKKISNIDESKVVKSSNEISNFNFTERIVKIQMDK